MPDLTRSIDGLMKSESVLLVVTDRKRFSRQVFSLLRDRVSCQCERENMHQNFIEYAHVQSVLPFLIRAGLSPLPQWQSVRSASGIGGCALHPCLFFPTKPRDSNKTLLSRIK
jgi:hypothetical protein